MTTQASCGEIVPRISEDYTVGIEIYRLLYHTSFARPYWDIVALSIFVVEKVCGNDREGNQTLCPPQCSMFPVMTIL